MSPAYASKLGLKVYSTNVILQKFDNSTFDTFEIVLAYFQIKNKLDKLWLFQEIFLIANTTLEVIFGILFLTLSNADVQFIEKKLTWRFYTTAKVFSTTKQVELISRKNFAKATLDQEW